MRPTCPKCGSHRTRVRYPAEDKIAFVIVRHRACDKCNARWSTTQPPEKFERLEIAVH